MRSIVVLRAAVAFLVLAAAARSGRAEPRVELELLTESGFPLTGNQQWLAVLKDVGASGIRIRSGRAGDRTRIETRGTPQSPVYHVTGILTSRNTLRVPGEKFGLADRAAIAAWIRKLQKGGEDELTKKTGPFGLTDKELVDLHHQLAVRTPFSTFDKSSGAIAAQLARTMTVGVTFAPEARVVLGGNETVGDQLQGVSAGTAMAAVLRPLGLVAVPGKTTDGKPRLLVTTVQKAEKSWPVGWPTEKSPGKLVPDMFKFLNVEIRDIPLSQALDAIQGRLKVPFLYDHNSLARERIDPAEVNVSVPKGKTYYKRILDRILFQARLKCEIRVDEAGKPLLWITTLRS